MEPTQDTLLAALRAENARLHAQQRELEGRMAACEQACRAAVARAEVAEAQMARLLRLHVASLQLHEARGLEQVLEAIQEIIKNIIGSEELAIYRLDASQRVLQLLSSQGVEPSSLSTVPLGYGTIGRVALTGMPFVAPEPLRPGKGSVHAVSACVPLSLGDQVHGALAIFGLLPQKRELEEVDHELLSLLSTQAGPALHRAELST